jgi:hypothetical protein
MNESLVPTREEGMTLGEGFSSLGNSLEAYYALGLWNCLCPSFLKRSAEQHPLNTSHESSVFLKV